MHPARKSLAFLSVAIVVLAAVLAVVLPVTMAPAAAASAAGTRVGASHPGMILAVRADHPVSAGEGRSGGLSQPGGAAGACVAPEDAGAAGGGVARLQQDINVNPAAPRALPLNRPVSASPTQNAWVQTRINYLQQQGALDIRVNQQQVNLAGIRVGINRPDLQYSLNGARWYEEFETGSLQAAEAHGPRIMVNDPAGQFIPWYVP